MNKRLKKLTLGRDTLRALENQELTAAIGAVATGKNCSAIDACPSRLCPTRLDC